jgi:hypothetical protein
MLANVIEDNYAGAAAIKDAPAEIRSAATLAARQSRGQRPGAGQRTPAAAVVAWVGELGEVIEQAAALRAGQRDGRGRMSGGGMGDDQAAGTSVPSGHGLRHP